MNELYLEHIGTKHHSGRYPWGSGENPYQRPYKPKNTNPFIDDKMSFYNAFRDMKEHGMTDGQICTFMDETYFGGKGKFKTTALRAWVTQGKEQQMAYNVARATELKNKGMSNVAIAEEMGTVEGTVRNWLDPARKEKLSSTRNITEVLKKEVEMSEKGILDVGKGCESALNCSKQKLDAAIRLAEEEGYKKYYLNVEQQGNLGKYTSIQVLAKEDTPYSYIRENQDKIGILSHFQGVDGGKDVKPVLYPKSVDSNRVMIRYAEDGGKEADGCMLIKPGVKDIALGDKTYMQVRIAVDDTNYLKGMAIYGKKEDFPKGVDIIFNTNKTKDVPMINPKDPDNQVLKSLKDDKDMPFGAAVKNVFYTDSDGKEVQSCINKVNDDDDWDKWSKSLASQFLGKQPKDFAKQQLGIAYDIKANELDTIRQIDNPTIRKKLLADFADECDSAATHMKGAPLSDQATKVMLPLRNIKDNEIYAPTLKQGEEVVLVRYPHTGPFESPRLKVNNRNKEGTEIIGNTAKNAVGVNSTVAEQLSGADFDGDTVVVLPVRGQHIKTQKVLDGLKDFDDKIEFKAYPGMPRVGKEDNFDKGREMGMVSNLITDMWAAGAPDSDLVKAVKHSMVIIDAEKHNLNWKLSAEVNQYKYLQEKYQKKENGRAGGASTLLSKATSPAYVGKRKEITSPNLMTPEEKKAWDRGEHVYRSAYDFYLRPKTPFNSMTDAQKQAFYDAKTKYNKELKEYQYAKAKDPNANIDRPSYPKEVKGVKIEEVERKETISKMAKAKDARELISDHNTMIENIYANYANNMKALALEARKEARSTGNMTRDPIAAKTYAKEVESIKEKVRISQMNAPKERMAQAKAEKRMSSYKKANPDMTKEEEKKRRNKLLAEARAEMGTNRTRVTLNEREVEAIKNGAISNNLMLEIFSNGDQDSLKKAFTPKNKRGMTSAQKSKAKRMLKAGYTQADVAEALGVSVATIQKNVEY
jgi:predicted transcriptional regulator